MPNRVMRDLSQLTRPEKLWLWRRRRRVYQDELAARLNVGRNKLREYERGNGAKSIKLRDLTLPSSATTAERLRLARRRSGLDMFAAARALGVSRPTLRAMEERADRRLIKYWQNQGFFHLTP